MLYIEALIKHIRGNTSEGVLQEDEENLSYMPWELFDNTCSLLTGGKLGFY